ncbi:TonB-dependent receptor [Bacteroides fragilis]|jgi:TonB-linked SusC/RagA family outer membrane protein|uniref:TonB-dependent receptor n=1 Tax=Bacteroides fragilis TaxID=817 RepID=A0A413K4K7_BACFG|nr:MULTISPECIES: TonB-dependent receptor [Bacteroides]EKA80581.1 SusC/RagA family TonB-linked outer membrane protein [Bacteroides fragilis HMW 616]MBY2894456.1 membrane protein [Bacteroides fragilis]MCE8601451.1 TonB-dependent receptor [Bacteroides fragilis]MCE8632186.1 TonB-dependent receptor [Bacteroides fragilis]MCE8678262.1 TonB-dependent receptor [Bacteroides fragilis]
MKLKINLRNILSVKIHKIVLLLLALCIYNTAYGQNQRISVYGNNQSLQKVFEQIEQQTKLSVTYNQTKLDVNKKIKENFIDKKLSFVMDALLKNTGFTCNYEPEHIVITPSVQPKEKAAAKQTVQMKKIMGKVTGITGEPLIGANVLAIGSKQATITNLNGEFTLEVPADGKLQVTYIGYLPQEVSTNGKTQIVIQLKEDSQLMDEVVVVGFGTQKKVNLTGAVTAVNVQETLGDRPIANITAALQGVVPGLKIEGATGTPGDNLSYNIRGTTSINGGGPLVLVNNVPMDINMIDPQDIESVSVLKDAASAAIYGARAAFGVILITTKQGKKDMAPKFNYNNNFSFSKALELPQKANPLESVLAYKEMGWPNDTYVDGKNIPQWETYVRDYMDNPSKYPQGYIFDEKGNLFLMRENDMFADMMENYGFMQNHSFSVSGGGSRTNYRIGLGYTNEDGILITDKDRYERANLSSFLSVEVNKWLTTQLDIRYANSTQNKVEQGGRNGVWGSAMQLPSYQNISPYEVDGITYPAETSATYIRYGEPRIVKKTDFRALGRIIISPLKNLKITGEYTYNRVTNYNRMYVKQYKYIGMNFTGILNNTENTRYALTQGFNNYNAINIFANYDFSIGNHNIGVMGGFNQEENHAESQWTERKDVLLSNLPSISGATGTTTATDTFNEYALRGLFYRVNYSYKDRYMVEANGRYDGTSRFPKNNRFGFFPSFSGGWRISEESFMAGTRSVLSNLKFRASWGSIGNQIILLSDGSPDNYPYIPEMAPGLTNWLVGGKKPTTLSTPPMVSSAFTWEKVYTLDFGVDFGFFDNRLNGTFDWYRRDTKGMLAPGMDLPWVVGVAAAKQNAADLKTYGWELELNWRDRIKDFSYRIGFNLYDSQSEITKFNNETNLLGTYRKGQKIGEIWGYVTDRFYREDDFNADGTLKEGIPIPKGAGKVYPGDVLYKNFDDDATTIWSGKGTADDPGDQRIIGNSTPRFHYGINAGLSWKGFDLSIFLRGVGKRDFWRTDQIAWPTATWGSLFKETLNFWTPEHTDAYFPRVYANNGVNTATNRWKQTKYLANAAYVKLQNITLSYTLPKVWTKQIYFDEVKVFFSGENLHTWDHLPEGLESDMLSKGAWEYPFMKKFSLGFNVTF